MEFRELGRTDIKVSAIGFGASPLGNVYGPSDSSEDQRAVQFAIDSGINFFDVSPYYGCGLAETRLGNALHGFRHQVFLATKCARYDVHDFGFSRKRVIAGFEESLARLGTDYVDLLQVHDIEFGGRQQIVHETLPALRDLQKQGKTRFIGITSYQLGLMAGIAEEEPLDSVLSYCRYNLLMDDLDLVLLPTLEKRGIGLINASPLHMGLLSGAPTPAWHPASLELKEAMPDYRSLCLTHGVEPAQFALRFCLAHPYAATTLVGMTDAKQVASNLRALELQLDSELLAQVDSLLVPFKNCVWPSGLPENADYQRQTAPRLLP